MSSAPAPTYDTDRVWTVPNVISLLRLLGVPLFLWLVLGPHNDVAAVAVLIVAGATDWIDGQIARRFHQVSRVGQMLDPIADRLYIMATLVGMAIRDVIPWWLVGILIARDVTMVCLVPFLRTRGFTSLPVHFLGKAATFCLLYAFPLVLLGADTPPDAAWSWGEAAKVFGWAFALWGTALYWWAGLLYVEQTRRLMRTQPPLPPKLRPGRKVQP